MIKMVKRIQTHRRPFCTPDADLCMLVDLPLDKKTVENQDWATGPPVLRAAGPSRAAGRWAFGPPGHWAVAGRGPSGHWAAGLLLAKPASSLTPPSSVLFSWAQK